MRKPWWTLAAMATGSMVASGIALPSAHAARHHTCFGRPATVVGSAEGEELKGTIHADVIVGLGGSDLIRGRGGADLICGNSGGDFLRGAHGDDRLKGGFGRDGIDGGNGGDAIKGGPGEEDAVQYLSSPRGVTASLVTDKATGQGHDRLGESIEAIFGSHYDDKLVGDDRFNLMGALDGHDVIKGKRGGDDLAGGHGDDLIIGGRGVDVADPLIDFTLPARVNVNMQKDTIHGHGNGSDKLITMEGSFGTFGDDRMIGDGGTNVFVVTLDGDDFIKAGGGRDLVDGGDGNDVLSGGSGRDYLGNLDHTAGVVVDLQAGTSAGKGEPPDDDAIKGFEDVLGSSFNDTLKGNNGVNALRGDAGSDALRGRGGADILIGDCSPAPGHFFLEGNRCDEGRNDSLTGGDGNDTCKDGEQNSSCEKTGHQSSALLPGSLRTPAYLGGHSRRGVIAKLLRIRS